MTDMLENETGRVYIRELGANRFELRGEGPSPDIAVPHSPCETAYPLELIRVIFEAYGAVHTCDEISRDTDETEAALDIEYSVKGYFEDDIFSKPLRILDYGCGAGSSTMALARLFPESRIEGRDFVSSFLRVAESRASHYGLDNLDFVQVPPSGVSSQGSGTFDIAFLNAVYEHLLPEERPDVISNVWSALKPGGALILNQTPHRWFPIEAHTSGLPLINYLPRSAALWAIRRFSKSSVRILSWDELLRAGVRGASVGEIMRNLTAIDPTARRLQPTRLGSTWAGIWYAAKRARLDKVNSSLTRSAIIATQRFVGLTRLPFAPYLNIAIVKGNEAATENT
jgi:2-polyprenyl-3-methyl-5-hydroxy-6-metoxy-1,4-benzoquinol methylase